MSLSVLHVALLVLGEKGGLKSGGAWESTPQSSAGCPASPQLPPDPVNSPVSLLLPISPGPERGKAATGPSNFARPAGSATPLNKGDFLMR